MNLTIHTLVVALTWLTIPCAEGTALRTARFGHDGTTEGFVLDKLGNRTTYVGRDAVTGHPKTGHRWAGQNRPVGLSSVYPITPDLGKAAPRSFS